jgi:phosphotransferase system  glucose/maltose/N-acetylglucosamine-specific IIC component
MKPIKPIIISGIVAGILDCISAVVFLGKMDYGLLFHFSIAIFWAIVFFFVVRKIKFFKHYIIVGGLFYGIMIWLVMNLVVLPFTNIPQNPMTAIGAIKNIAILMLCVGLPISWIQDRLKNYDN